GTIRVRRADSGPPNLGSGAHLALVRAQASDRGPGNCDYPAPAGGCDRFAHSALSPSGKRTAGTPAPLRIKHESRPVIAEAEQSRQSASVVGPAPVVVLRGRPP